MLHDRGTDRLLADLAQTPRIPLTALGVNAITPEMSAVHTARALARETDDMRRMVERRCKDEDRLLVVLTSLRDGYNAVGDALENGEDLAVIAAAMKGAVNLTAAIADEERCPCCGSVMVYVNEDDSDDRSPHVMRVVGRRCDDCNGWDETRRLKTRDIHNRDE